MLGLDQRNRPVGDGPMGLTEYYSKAPVWLLVLCDTWNWSDDNDTASGIEYRDTITIPETEMNYAISMSFRIRILKSQSIGINMQWQLFLQEIVLINN